VWVENLLYNSAMRLTNNNYRCWQLIATLFLGFSLGTQLAEESSVLELGVGCLTKPPKDLIVNIHNLSGNLVYVGSIQKAISRIAEFNQRSPIQKAKLAMLDLESDPTLTFMRQEIFCGRMPCSKSVTFKIHPASRDGFNIYCKVVNGFMVEKLDSIVVENRLEASRLPQLFNWFLSIGARDIYQLSTWHRDKPADWQRGTVEMRTFRIIKCDLRLNEGDKLQLDLPSKFCDSFIGEVGEIVPSLGILGPVDPLKNGRTNQLGARLSEYNANKLLNLLCQKLLLYIDSGFHPAELEGSLMAISGN
jgi:hypothetical protein